MKYKLIDIDYIEKVVDGVVVKTWIPLSFLHKNRTYDALITLQEDGKVWLYKNDECILTFDKTLFLDQKKKLMNLVDGKKIGVTAIYLDAFVIQFIGKQNYSLILGYNFQHSCHPSCMTYEHEFPLPEPIHTGKRLFPLFLTYDYFLLKNLF